MSVPRRRTQCRRGNDWEQLGMEGGKELNEGVARGVAVAVAVQQGRKASRNAFAPLQRGRGEAHVFTYAYSYIWYMVYASGMSGASFALLPLQLQLQLVAAAYQLIRCECDFNCCPQSTPCDDAFAKLESVWRQSRNLWTSSSL